MRYIIGILLILFGLFCTVQGLESKSILLAIGIGAIVAGVFSVFYEEDYI